ncbi:discoidin domain-containing protein [Neobacillus mesonae]|uniref:discoidin domain-containing protein n=1 Tax=Neobacillus mesonae TaxID=1193713 RepID=UPI002572E312|nr:discoidin domain-containing protein [Neobacillus mesonae]
MKKMLSMFLSTAVALSVTFPIGSHSSSTKVSAAEPSFINIAKDKVEIGNNSITRVIDVSDSKLKTKAVTNKRIGKDLVPEEGSEDFIIHLVPEKQTPEDPDIQKPKSQIDRKNWTAKVSDSSGKSKDGATMLDGDDSTYVDFYDGKKAWPYEAVIDLKEERTIGSFGYQKRPGYQDQAYGINGTLGKYEIKVSSDGENWTDAGTGEFSSKDYNLHKAGNLYNVGDMVYGNLTEAKTARYFKIVQLSGALSDDISFTGAEIYLFEDTFKRTPQDNSEPDKNTMKASELTIKQVKEEEYKTGKRVQFVFEDYEKYNSVWNIKYNVFVEDSAPYLRSNLEIKSSNKDIAIDFIDVDQFILPNYVEGLFHHPPLKDISSMWIGKYELVLGQPIYANGMFFGSEFPASDTDVLNNKMQVRYYSGKNFKKLAEDKQLNADGSFTTWNSVMGAADGTDKDVVQTDFFAYINDISTKTEFRKQYNSWYDNMLDITDESIANSFYGTEKELSKNGVEPLDSYVVDDGWNAYETVNSAGQETKSPYDNKTGFWEFNNKFPNELYPASDMAKKFASTFGLWLGPQGGYNYFGGFAEFLEKNGTGHVTNDYWKSVDVGSKTYVNNLTKLFLDYQNRFDIEYWKLDGFALRPSTDLDNQHMVGGDNNMYYTSDLWETWIDTFKAMRQEREEKGRSLFLNLTCYVNPSPWLLQWANTIWIQDSGDNGFLSTYGGTQAEQMMSYRDNVYFNIFKKNDLQFPLKNVYNHDPIYGVSAGIKFSDDDFRNYLMINATRGTAFWELYFSPSIMNDAKWRITADVLEWAESNSKTLEKAKLFGKRPDQGGVYGYSAWNGGEGIVSFRNAGNKEQSYTLTLDNIVGVPTDLKNAKMTQILPRVDETKVENMSYGDTLTVTLAPHESRIYQFTSKTEAPAKAVSVKNTNENTVKVKFDQRIQNPAITVNGKPTKAVVLEDYRTVELTTSKKIEKENQIDINIENIWGISADIKQKFHGYPDGYAAKLFEKTDIVDGQKLQTVHFEKPNINLYGIDGKEYSFKKQISLVGKDDFSILFKFRSSGNDQLILNQEGAYSIAIDKKGYLNFTVGEAVVNSKAMVTTVAEKASGTFGTKEYKPTTTTQTVKGKVDDGNLHDVKAVREANGMIKLYLDGELISSKYVKDPFTLPNGKITLGSKKTTIQIADIEIKNEAVAYDEAKKSYEDLNLKPGYKELDRTGYKAFADSEEKQAGVYEGPAANVLDGKTSTWWHTQYNGGLTKPPHWLTIEMPEAAPVDAYEYVSRNGNGNVKKYELQVSDMNEEGTWKTVNSGEMDNGGSTLIKFDKPIKAKFYRLYITETYGSPANTFASAAEIKLFKNMEGTSDFSKLAAAYEEIYLLDVNHYTKQSLESSGFNGLKDKIVNVYENPNSSQTVIDEAVSDFTQNYEVILSKLEQKGRN